jgi:anti-sigma factor RsiW
MEPCARPDIAERLIITLSSSDFAPDEVAELQEHLKECPSCQEEMTALKRMETFLIHNKDLVAESLSPCPSIEKLSAFAAGEMRENSLEYHTQLCKECREHVALIRELLQEQIPTRHKSASKQEKQRFCKAALQAYPENKPRQGAIRTIFDKLNDLFYIPSLALGAAVAALLMIVIVPKAPHEMQLVPALSNVVWEKPSLPAKGDLAPKTSPLAKKKIALILLFRGPEQAMPENADQIYSKLDIAKRLGATYDFLSPNDISTALGGRLISENLISVSHDVFEKTDADYLLTFEILKANSGAVLKGTLFERGRKIYRGSISQTGLAVSQLPPKITLMGTELLFESEQHL